ncbi:HNH endonuclease family protein [Pseudomonas sp. NMI1173_11]|nr:HNH endonuclease family protein [Pseudomonas sp. NMI1173_11]
MAPSTEPAARPHGYGTYDETFKGEYLNCLGNYLLLSKPHNCAVGNIPFSEKLATYKHTFQQREIATFVSAGGLWDRDAIQVRHDKIVAALMAEL